METTVRAASEVKIVQDITVWKWRLELYCDPSVMTPNLSTTGAMTEIPFRPGSPA